MKKKDNPTSDTNLLRCVTLIVRRDTNEAKDKSHRRRALSCLYSTIHEIKG